MDVEKNIAETESAATDANAELKSISLPLKEAKAETGLFSILCTIAACGCGTIACIIIQLFFAIIPIFMVYYGATHLHDCPISNFIPVYLLVTGIFALIDQSTYVRKCCSKQEKGNTESNIVGVLTKLFLFVWFIVGAVKVYQIYEPPYDSSLELYCHKTTYLFVFILITFEFCILALFVLYIIYHCIWFLIFGDEDDD